ncbi:MAG: hypothetical protein EZS28_047930 [Streblomastix strix]|uniref:Uncharacterized protein n=1 Tax=Streblomastix strix TaxID=222440 RepID=A0A5J4TFI8_9EUKA|nr:MAG: hypothetical protein EZS28_047930 [Streblomastix strix]
MAQSCQVSWQITIPAGRLALQLNLAATAAIATEALARARVNFNGFDDPQADWVRTMAVGAEDNELPINPNERIKLWIGYSTACGPFQQIAICKDNTKLWETSIYAREQAVIAANSLSDECTRNSVSVSSLESIVRGRRHCGIFLDIPVSDFAADSFNYTFPSDITIAGILGGIKKVAGWVTPTLHKVMGTLSGPVSMLHPGAGQIMGTVGNIAGAVDRHLNKR